MKSLLQIAIVVVVIWFVCKWWKHRKLKKQTSAGVNAAHAALGASTRVGSNLGSSANVIPPSSQGYGQATPGAPTGAMPLTNAPTSSSPVKSIFSAGCGCN